MLPRSLFAGLTAVLLASSPLYAQGLFEELFAPWPDRHASPHGTPYAHPFSFDPAFQDRDLLVDYRPGYGFDDGNADEQEFEVEIEYALTKRLGMVLEVPYVGIDEHGQNFESGFGDMAAVGRLVLVDRPCLILSAHLEVEIPTGDEQRDLGRGETALAPTLTWWTDLGNWWTFQGQFGPEVGTESNETELLYRFLIAKSWQGPILFDDACSCMRPHCSCTHSTGAHHEDEHDHEDHHYHAHDEHDHGDHSHHAPGLITFYLETTGATPLNIPGETTHFDLLPGVGYGITHSLEFRFGVRFPLTEPREFDTQYVFSFVRHL